LIETPSLEEKYEVPSLPEPPSSTSAPTPLVSVPPLQPILAGATFEPIVAAVPAKKITVVRSDKVLNAGELVAFGITFVSFALRQVDMHGSRARRIARRIVAGATLQGIALRAAFQQVIAVSAREPVRAGTAAQFVVAIAAIEHVVPASNELDGTEAEHTRTPSASGLGTNTLREIMGPRIRQQWRACAREPQGCPRHRPGKSGLLSSPISPDFPKSVDSCEALEIRRLSEPTACGEIVIPVPREALPAENWLVRFRCQPACLPSGRRAESGMMPAGAVCESGKSLGLSASGADSRARLRSAAVLALFATMLVVVGPRHEPWLDETQAWVLGRDTTLTDLLAHRVGYEGTPGLWQALLWLLSHAGVPFGYMWLVSGALACGGAWIILTRAPFPLWLRVGVIFSYFIGYQYAVVARSYALDVLVIPLIAATFADRLRKPVLYGAAIGLCAHLNAHSFIIAAILFAEFLVAIWRADAWQRAHLLGAAVFCALSAIAVLFAWPPAEASFAKKLTLEGVRAMIMIGQAFIDRWDVLSSSPPTEFSTIVGFALSMLLLAPSVLLFRRAGIAALVTALFLALIFFSVVKYANVWHSGLLYLVWIFALWAGWHALPQLPTGERRLVVASVAIIVFVNVLYTASAALRDVREPYSAGPAAARVVAPLRQQGAVIAAAGFKTFALQPWFDTNLFANYRNGAPHMAHYVFRSDETFQPFVTLESWRETANNNAYNVLLLSNYEIPSHMKERFAATARDAGYCEVAEVPGGLIWKSYVRERDGIVIFSRCAGAQPKPAQE
jgi:hypothetical protein